MGLNRWKDMMFRFPRSGTLHGTRASGAPARKKACGARLRGGVGGNGKFPLHSENYAFAISWLAIISSARTSAE